VENLLGPPAGEFGATVSPKIVKGQGPPFWSSLSGGSGESRDTENYEAPSLTEKKSAGGWWFPPPSKSPRSTDWNEEPD